MAPGEAGQGNNLHDSKANEAQIRAGHNVSMIRCAIRGRTRGRCVGLLSAAQLDISEASAASTDELRSKRTIKARAQVSLDG